MKQRLLLAGVALLGLAGCTSISAPVDAEGTLFEVEYVNFAWVPTSTGFVIEPSGRIHSFDLGGRPWTTADDEWVSGPELEAKWATNSEEKGTVSSSVVEQMSARVGAAAAGGLSEPVNRCADAGTITYSAYRYDPTRAKFQRVVVRREGDIAQLSKSLAGRAIADWLVSLELYRGFDGCQP